MSSTETIRVAIAYYSGSGHTARQAEAVARGAASVPGVQVGLHNVAELTDALWTALDQADAIIFGAPTYMGSPSAVFKTFAERTSRIFADNMRWKDKIAAGFTNSQTINGDKLNSLIDLAILAAQHGMHWVNLGLYAGWDHSTGSIEDLNRLGSWLGAMAQSNADAGPDVAPPRSDLETAEALGRRVALVTRQWVRGRALLAEETLQSGPVDQQEDLCRTDPLSCTH
ncbi:MAG: flavodoxin family protein [Ktedonobacteraceae bacterium]|nr:flavodoxin family protein [Ktedonobacteraceae bacterium]